MTEARRVQRLDADTEADFLAIHCERQGMGWCACVAWWVPTWEGWGGHTAEQNLALRRDLWARGEHDGYLAYVGDEPVPWTVTELRLVAPDGTLLLAKGIAPREDWTFVAPDE